MTQFRRWRIENDPDLATFASYGSLDHPLTKRFPGDFRDTNAVLAIANRIALAAVDRQRLAASLASFHAECGGDDIARANIAALEDPGSLVVATGQQPGLFGGPVYTIYKALTAISLARKWSQILNRRIVPVFWIASDDHDLHEIESATFVNGALELSRYRADLGAFGPPIADLSTRETHTKLAHEFASDCLGDFEERSAKWLPRVGEPWSSWFARILLEMTQGTGLVVADPYALREALAPHLDGELARPERSPRALLRGAEELRRINVEPSLDANISSCLFVTLSGRRHRYDPTRHLANDIVRARETSRSGLSGDAALRSVLQSRILPVLAVVGGPGEYRYWSQLRELFDDHGTSMPLFVPRFRATVVWPAVRKHLDALALPEVEWLVPEADALASLRALDSPEMTPWLDQKGEIRTAFEQLASMLTPLGGSVPARIEQARVGLEQSLTRLLEVAASRQREAAGSSAKRRRAIANALRPGGKPQERVFASLGFALRFGFDFFPRLAESLEVEELRASFVEFRH